MDDPNENDEVFELEGANIVLDSKIIRDTDTLNIRLENYEWGEDLVITSDK
jgi:hypothetical protein